MATYEQKKKSCTERMIDFNFTKEQWVEMNKLKEQVSCAYSNVKFINKLHHKHSPTLERIFPDRPYSIENCLWVTKLSNDLKSCYIENGNSEKGLSSTDVATLRRIRRILESTDNIKTIQEPYKHLFTEQKETTSMSTEKKAPSCYDYNKTFNKELVVAKLFAGFGAFVEQKWDSEFNLTFSQFKLLITRKRCMLTLRTLPEDLFARGFWVKDKTRPVDKDNLLITTKELQTALDSMCVNANLDITTLKLLGKALTK